MRHLAPPFFLTRRIRLHPGFLALASLLLLLQLLPAEEESSLKDAATAFKNGQFSRVIEMTNSILENHPGDIAAADLRAGAYQRRGEINFRAGKIEASIADFDRFLKRYPERKPHHWQRGISLYYAGKYKEGKRQFEIHQTVNSQDVENAVWNFLCTTRAPGFGLEQARDQFIAITGDRRVPMKQVHALFAGDGGPEAVLDAAGEDKDALFYAHLYLGLYYEALEQKEKSLRHVKKAAVDYAQPHYMGDVARVHLALRSAKQEPGTANPEPKHYSTRERTRDGIGKIYMGREIAQVVGHGAIRWLERPEREREELPDKVVENMELKPGDVVADIGAGSGYFTFRVARKIDGGKAVAVDINEQMLEFISDRCKELGVDNVKTHLGTISDTKLPADTVDLAYLVDAYHEFSHPREMMESIVVSLKPGGRLVLLEYRKEDPTVAIKPLHKMTQAQAKKEMAAVGLEWIETRDFLPSQHFMIFRKPGETPPRKASAGKVPASGGASRAR